MGCSRNLFQVSNAFNKIFLHRRKVIFKSIFVLIIFSMSLFDSLLMADMTAGGKDIPSGHFQVIVNGFQSVFHIHRLLIKSMDFGNVKVCSNDFV